MREEYIRLTIQLLSIVVTFTMSSISLWLTLRLWYGTNRPIITAYVQTESAGNMMISYNIVVTNSGNRPGIQVQLQVNESDLIGALQEEITEKSKNYSIFNGVMRCFKEDGIIPVLTNGQSTVAMFGFTRGQNDSDKFWKYGSTIPILIKYSDLEGKKYTSKLFLVIKSSEGFAGSAWRKSDSK